MWWLVVVLAGVAALSIGGMWGGIIAGAVVSVIVLVTLMSAFTRDGLSEAERARRDRESWSR